MIYVIANIIHFDCVVSCNTIHFSCLFRDAYLRGHKIQGGAGKSVINNIFFLIFFRENHYIYFIQTLSIGIFMFIKLGQICFCTIEWNVYIREFSTFFVGDFLF